MVKIYLDKKTKEKFSLEEMKKDLEDKHFAYVLLTCSNPSEDGNMEVEMSCNGEEDLIAYLLQSGYDIFTQKEKNGAREIK